MRNTAFLRLNYIQKHDFLIAFEKRLKELQELNEEDGLDEDEKVELAEMIKEKEDRATQTVFHEQHERHFKEECAKALSKWIKNMGFNIPEGDISEYIIAREYDVQVVKNACYLLYDQNCKKFLFKYDKTLELTIAKKLELLLEDMYEEDRWDGNENSLHYFMSMVFEWYYDTGAFGVSQRDIFDSICEIGLQKTDTAIKCTNVAPKYYEDWGYDMDDIKSKEGFLQTVRAIKAEQLNKKLDKPDLDKRIHQIQAICARLDQNVLINIGVGNICKLIENDNTAAGLFNAISEIVESTERQIDESKIDKALAECKWILNDCIKKLSAFKLN